MAYPIFIIALVSYLLGNINGSVCISTLLEGEDVRTHGSGNAGLTNFFRNYGSWNTALVALIEKTIAELGVESKRDMGKVMGIATKQLAGKAEGKTISTIVKQLLAN